MRTVPTASLCKYQSQLGKNFFKANLRLVPVVIAWVAMN